MIRASCLGRGYPVSVAGVACGLAASFRIQVRVPQQHNSGLARLALIAIALALVVYFTSRGPVRAMRESGDLVVGYAGAQAWMAGDDPYDPEALRGHFQRSGGGEQATVERMDFMRNIYLPLTIPMFVPLALMPWGIAKAVWASANVAGLGVIAWGVLHLAGVPWRSGGGLILLGLALAMAPVHTAIAIGQASIVSAALIVLAAVLGQSGRPAWSGVLYGLATAVKVQIGLPFVVYALWRRQWVAGAVASAVVVVMLAASVGRMELAQVDWLASRQANVEKTMASGGYNDAVRGSSGRYTLINLQYLVHSVTDSRLAANGVALAVVGGLGLLMVWRTGMRDLGNRELLLALSVVGCLTLLVSYHRTYDAVLMLLPAGWALAGLGKGGGDGERAEDRMRGRLYGGVLLCCASFIVPGQVVLQHLADQGVIPAGMMEHPIWQVTAMAQHAWAIVICATVLVWASGRTSVSRD